jgi:NAD(P)H-dependent FMN reductase
MTKLKIVTGSTRPGRFNIQPAQWFLTIAKERKDIEVELLDIADFNLPILDEPSPALMHNYTKDHTKAWAKALEEADGFVFIAPEYNHSVPGSFKNAIDYVNLEWNYKPVSFVSYGSMAGGARSVEHLRGIAGELRMFDLREQLLLPNYYLNLDEKGNYKFSEQEVKTANLILDELSFWATAVKGPREELAAKKSQK